MQCAMKKLFLTYKAHPQVSILPYSQSHQHVSEHETGPTGTHELRRSVYSLLREAYKVQGFLFGAALKGDQPDH